MEKDQLTDPLLTKHTHDSQQSIKKLYLAAIICFVFMVIEIIGGAIAHSLAIMTDAAHMFSDLSGFAIAIASLKIASKPASSNMSYGYHRSEIIGAVISVALIWGLTIWLLYEAVVRVINPVEVDGLVMLITALLGLGCNILMAWSLHPSHGHSHGHSHDHSHSHSHPKVHYTNGSEHDSHIEMQKHQENVGVRAAALHVLGDIIQSVGVTIAGVLIFINPEWKLADPICTFVFSIIVMGTTFPIIKESLGVLMEGAPLEIDVESLGEDLADIGEVSEVHDLHVWSLSIGKPSMSCHLTSNDPHTALQKATQICKNKYGITHTTIQIELATVPEEQPGFECTNSLH